MASPLNWHAPRACARALQAPVMTMYAAGTGLIPLPFQASLESLLGRPAVTLMDIQKVRVRAVWSS